MHLDWPSLAELLALLAAVLAAIFARGALTRVGYMARFIPAIVACGIAYVAAVKWGHPFAQILFIVLNTFIWRWTAMRLNDVGWGKLWLVLWLVPPAGLILAITLCIKHPPETDIAEVFD